MTVVDLIVSIGRFIEYQLTGQSDFRLGVPFVGTRTVQTELEGRLQLDGVRAKLYDDFRLSLSWPILLEIKKPPPLGWKAGFYHSEGNIGRYETKELGENLLHHITIQPNLEVSVFQAILAHELVHAVQTEKRLLLGNHALREGMARWVEYHFLVGSHPKLAQRLLRLRHYTFGKSIETIIDYENLHGRMQTIKWLNSLEKVS